VHTITSTAEELRITVETKEKSLMADLRETLQAAPSFKTLISTIKAAGLVDMLKDPGPFTLFAPTDDAFAKLPEGTPDSLLKDTQRLKELLLYHVVADLIMPPDLLERRFIKTVQGQRLTVEASLDAVEVDEILIPLDEEDEEDDEDVEIVVDLDEDEDEEDEEDEDEDEDEEDEDEDEDIDLLVTTLYERVKINGANVAQVIPADNGIIYALDKVLTPPKRRQTRPATQGSPASQERTTPPGTSTTPEA
jgi:uncharacterized surface protein with fasciclin (FAS1) repeats